MELQEKKLSGETLYEGRILRLERDRVLLPNGREGIREVCRHRGGVCVLPITRQGQVLLVRQFRYPYGQELLELPAGKLEPGEEPLPAALRELEEETGHRAERLHPLGEMYPTPGCMDEVLYLYYADQLTPTQMNPDEDEFLEVVSLPLAEAVDRVMAGDLPDAKTQVALLKYWLLTRDNTRR